MISYTHRLGIHIPRTVSAHGRKRGCPPGAADLIQQPRIQAEITYRPLSKLRWDPRNSSAAASWVIDALHSGTCRDSGLSRSRRSPAMSVTGLTPNLINRERTF